MSQLVFVGSWQLVQVSKNLQKLFAFHKWDFTPFAFLREPSSDGLNNTNEKLDAYLKHLTCPIKVLIKPLLILFPSLL